MDKESIEETKKLRIAWEIPGKQKKNEITYPVL